MLKFGYHRNFYFIYSIEQCVNNKFKELCRYYWRLQKELHIHIETNFFEAAGQLSYIAGSIDIALHSVHYWYKHQYATLHITHYHMHWIFFPQLPRALSQLSQSCLCLPSSQFHAAVIVEVHRFVDFRGGIPSMEVNPDWNGVRFNLQRKGVKYR